MLPERTWLSKFGDAFRGIARGVGSQSSFAVHIPVAVLAIVVAAVLGVSRLEWALIAAAIGFVLATEVMNTAVEFLAKAVTKEYDPFVRDALDVASAAVMVSVVTAAAIGALILGPRVWALFAA